MGRLRRAQPECPASPCFEGSANSPRPMMGDDFSSDSISPISVSNPNFPILSTVPQIEQEVRPIQETEKLCDLIRGDIEVSDLDLIEQQVKALMGEIQGKRSYLSKNMGLSSPELEGMEAKSVDEQNQTSNWKGLFDKPPPKKGMPLTYIPPMLKEGCATTCLHEHTSHKLEDLWKLKIVLFVGGKQSLLHHVRREASSNYLSAKGDEAVEDTSAQNCSLFTYENRENGAVVLKHVQTGKYLNDSLRNNDEPFRLVVNDGSPANNVVPVDLDQVIKLPQRIVLKCNTGEYLMWPTTESPTLTRHQYFEGTDPNNTDTWYITSYDPLGKVRLLPFYLWSRNVYWYCTAGDSGVMLRTDHHGDTEFARFKVFQMSGNSICLINSQGFFLRKKSTSAQRYLYTADATSAVAEAVVQVEEPVVRRTIELTYHLKDAQIYDLEPRSWLSGVTTNSTDEPIEATLTVEFSKTRTYSASISTSLSTSVTTTFKGGIPFIAKGEVSVEVGINIETGFGYSEDISESASNSVKVTIPPRQRRQARMIATEGKCNVSFSYDQVDVLANGERVETRLSDGVFKGMNGYEFHTEVYDPYDPTVVLASIPLVQE